MFNYICDLTVFNKQKGANLTKTYMVFLKMYSINNRLRNILFDRVLKN